MLIALIAFGAMPAAAADGGDPQQPKARHSIVFGGDASFPPFEFLDANDRPSGFQVELIRAIARTMDFDLEIRLGPWIEISEGFRGGAVDVVGLFDQPERHAYADFCSPHTTNGSEFFIRFGSPEILSFQDLAGKEVIVQAGALAEETIRARGIQAVFIPVTSEADAIRLLASGKHDAAIVTQFGGRLAMKRHGLTNITTSGPLILASDYCLTVRRGNTALLNELNQGLEILKRTGEYNRLYEQWLGELERPAVSFRTVLKYAFWVVAPLLTLFLLALIWVRSLQYVVERRTSQLRRELRDRIAAQAALRESEQRWRTLIEHAPDAVLVYDRQQNRFIEANENATSLLHLGMPELKSTGLVEIFAPEQPDHESPA